MDLSIGMAGFTLTSGESGATYQWLDCNAAYAIIPGETNQVFTATADGSYAVELTNGSGCVDTSVCAVVSGIGFSEIETVEIQIFPNPAEDKIQINLDENFAKMDVVIFDMTGRAVHCSTQTSTLFELDITHLNSGVYLLQINADEKYILNTQLVKN